MNPALCALGPLHAVSIICRKSRKAGCVYLTIHESLFCNSRIVLDIWEGMMRRNHFGMASVLGEFVAYSELNNKLLGMDRVHCDCI
jgi:hypothetical protein